MMSISSLVLGLWQFLFIRNWPEVWKSEIPFAWVLPRIWRLGRVKYLKFHTNVSKKLLLNAAKCQGYSFYCFCVIKRRPTWEEKLSILIQIRFNIISWSFLGYTQGHCQVKPNKVYSSKQLTKIMFCFGKNMKKIARKK